MGEFIIVALFVLIIVLAGLLVLQQRSYEHRIIRQDAIIADLVDRHMAVNFREYAGHKIDKIFAEKSFVRAPAETAGGDEMFREDYNPDGVTPT